MSTTHPSAEPTAGANLEQSFATEGIETMLRPSLTTRFFMKIVSWAEGLNLKLSKVGNPAVYDNAVLLGQAD